MPFDGLRVLSLESRRHAEIAELIHKQGGVPFVAPSMRELPLGADVETERFAERLYAGEFDMMVLLTGVGTRQLYRLLGPRFAEALRGLTLVARGPKPTAALREMGLAPAVVAPEPNTWRELLQAMEGRPEKRIAVQEYGRSNPELLGGLRARGAEVTALRVYQWGLPEDTGLLREAARRLAAREFDVALFTTAMQISHLAKMAREQGIEDAAMEGLRHCFVGSIGPTTTEALEDFDVHPAFEPSHPKMGVLVLEAAQRTGKSKANGRPRLAVHYRGWPKQSTGAAKYAEYSGLAMTLPACTFVGYAIGHYLDKAFGTTWLQIVFLILGSAAGFIALIRQIKRDSDNGGA